MYPNIDFDSHSYISSLHEPYPVSQTLVLQITNPGAENLSLYNDTGKISFDLKPLEDAQPIEGLTMFYLTFPLGQTEDAFTTEAFFEQITISLPDTLHFQKVGNDTIVIYPTATISLEQPDLLEILFGNVISMGEPGQMVCIDVACFDRDTKIALGRRALYRKIHPLKIGTFLLDRTCEIAAFRDKLTFSYAVYGATQNILTPGDVVLSTRYPAGGGVLSVETMIYRPTFYGLHAFHGENMVSETLECDLKKASIQSFQGSYTVNKNQTRDVTLEIVVENTRHAYLHKIGRIAVTPGQVCTQILKNQSPEASYILIVENEDGLTTRDVTWK